MSDMSTAKKRSQFVVRELRNQAELQACSALDHSYHTEQVWQMDVRDDGDDMAVRFRLVHLPRTMQVCYPRDSEKLLQLWEQRDCFLVAVADDVVLGYVNMHLDSVNEKGWIRDLVVGAPFRRRRLGSALLEQAARWASMRGTRHLTLEMQTKNYPGIQFAHKHGFVFCGFNDRYYTNQDIAIFYGKTL